MGVSGEKSIERIDSRGKNVLPMGGTVAGVSMDDLKDFRSGRTPSLVSSEYSDAITSRSEVDPTTNKPLSSFALMPGIPALGIWMTIYVSAIAYINWKRADELQGPDAVVLNKLPLEEFIQMSGVFVFVLFIFLDLASTSMQVSPKKRQLSSIILYINAVCACMYCTIVFGFAPKIRDIQGADITDYAMHMLEWSFTTPCMIIVIDSLGTPMKNSIVSDWKSVGTLLLLDEMMLLFGFLSLYFAGQWVTYFCYGISSVCYILVCIGIHQSVENCIEKTATTFEAASIRYLEISTYVLWTVFPLLHLADLMGYVTPAQHGLTRILCDVVAKTVYSVSLLSGNFCLLDTIAELRAIQMKEAQAAKSSKILKVSKMNEALQMAVIEAETSARLSRKFIANVSHELRTPLNSVINFNGLLLDTDLEETQHEYVSSALTSAQALLGVINQVLDFSKLDASNADNIHLEMHPFYFTTLCEEVEDIIAARIAERNVDFKVSCPMKSACLIGDCFRIRQCLINLSDNAVKFAKAQGGEVTLSVKLSPDEDAGFMKVSLDVTDNGAGIPLEKQSLLFKPFSQVESNYARQHQGTGLGLAISKKIMEAMNGTITCISGEGCGTTFHAEFLLSVCSEEDTLIEPQHAKVPLDGEVVMCMDSGLTAEMIKEHCLLWGLKLQDLSGCMHDLERNVDRFMSRIRQDANEVMFIGYENYLKVKQTCANFDSSKVLVVGKLPQQAGAISRGEVDVQGFVPTPVKVSVLHSRLQSRLAASKTVSDGPFAEPVSTESSEKLLNSPIPSSSSTRASRTGSSKSGSGSVVSAASTVRATKSVVKSSEKPTRVLIVEDHSVNQKVAIAMITKVYGKNAVTFKIAEHGQEGLEIATQNPNFDLILMDCQMPFMDGLECTRKIREWEKGRAGTPYYIMAMTAHASKDDARDCLTAGMDDYCSKPLSMPVLKESLSRFEKWSREQSSI